MCNFSILLPLFSILYSSGSSSRRRRSTLGQNFELNQRARGTSRGNKDRRGGARDCYICHRHTPQINIFFLLLLYSIHSLSTLFSLPHHANRSLVNKRKVCDIIIIPLFFALRGAHLNNLTSFIQMTLCIYKLHANIHTIRHTLLLFIKRNLRIHKK